MRKRVLILLPVFFFFFQITDSNAQLASYQFTGQKACPVQNPNVTSQPANAVFSSFSTVNANCKEEDDNVYSTEKWNIGGTINLAEYHQFSVTANAGYGLNLVSFSFTHYIKDEDNLTTQWILRSSVDNYATNLGTGITRENSQASTATLPAANFYGLSNVTFRIYLVNSKDDGNKWSIDNVSLSGSVTTLITPPPTPTSDAPKCAGENVTITANGSAPDGETWYWQTSASGTNVSNSSPTYIVNTPGTYYLRSQNNTTLEWSAATSIVINSIPDVGTPLFTLGAGSTRCQGAGTVSYGATASNSTAISYSLDAASIAAGNSIDGNTGAVTYVAGWSGVSVITATATGCNGPKTASHNATTNQAVTVPVFAQGTSSFRCLGASVLTYTATASNATNIVYSLDAVSALTTSINPATGAVTYTGLSLTSTTITATANGCGGPRTATHTVTVNSQVGTPLFILGVSSTRCQGAGTQSYAANAANASRITYTLDATSTGAGNSINPSTGVVTYVAGWSGVSTITATAEGCSGPKTASHTATTNLPVATPVFTLGAASVRCQGTGLNTYTATASNATNIVYSLNAAAIAGGNSITPSSGVVSFAAGWTGTTIVTATANGCGGPLTATHEVTITPTVGAPVFLAGASSTRCQGAGTVGFSATASNATAITYTIDATTAGAGNTINSATGEVNFTTGWVGTTTITATAAGCNGPKTATHTVSSSPSVGVPLFDAGSVSTRSQGAETITYSSTAANNTGITYTLDAASIAGGNTINSSTGAVIYAPSWSGTSVITASAAGCNGPKTATHTVTINTTSVVKQLYLSDPAQALDRVDPVNTNDATTASSPILSTAGTTNTTFTLAALCDSLIIKAGTITVRTYVTVSSGTMPATPNVTALIRRGTTTILSLSNPSYNAGLLTWTASLPADVKVSAGEVISLRITTAQAGVNFRIDFDSQTKPSRIDLPVSSFINIVSLNVYSAAYPSGIPVSTAVSGVTRYVRATVTDPFGSGDITAMNVIITPNGNTLTATSVATAGCTRTYEYAWTIPAGASGNYSIKAVAKEGFENTVTNSRTINLSVCTTCPPVAVNDSITGAGGTPLVADVLSNDNDPNNNINPASLTIVGHPKNGSAYISNGTIVYLPNGTFQGKDTVTYQVCDLTSPAALCATAQVFFTIDPLVIDICGDASKTHTYYIPYPSDQSFIALRASSSSAMPSNNIRTVISIKVPYPGMRVVWDEWEDGYETNALNPTQSTTKVWGDGNPFNGIAPGYPNDIIPAGASIVLDNTMNANPRNASAIYYDGKDKVTSSGQIALTQVAGEPSVMSVQAIKTNITSTFDFGQSFTIPLGQDFNSRDFRYTAMFIRAAENNTTINIDKNNDGVFETTTTLNQGGSYLVDGGVLTGATVASDKPIGVELSAGGVDNWSIRNAPIFPATWYSNTYYTPVPTADVSSHNPKDSSVVMFYNSLNRPITINWYFGATPTTGVINVPAKSAVRFPLRYSATATYKFVNLTGESFTAIEIIDSYTPGGGGNTGDEYDWAFNLISELRLTDFATVAWAPGSIDGSRNDNPIWVTPTANTTLYVKYDGDVSNGSLTSPCGLKYDAAITLNALNYTKIKDPNDNDQSGIALYTCNGAKIAAVYGEDPTTAVQANPSWDVGATIQPFCKERIVIATDDYATSLVGQPVTISVLNNDLGFLCTIDPSTVSTVGLLQPKNGTATINENGTILYIPAPGFSGIDTFEYRVCSTPSPIVCDVAMVVVTVSTCPSNGNQNVISGQAYLDRNEDQLNNDGSVGLAGVKIYLYTDGNCDGIAAANELTDSTVVDGSGFYQFTKLPEKTVEDNFDGPSGRSCADGSDGDTPWASNWTDPGDASSGFCNNSATADVEIVQDGSNGYVLRLKDADKQARRSVNLSGATRAFLSFSYRRKNSLSSSESVFVQASSNGTNFTTIYTIDGGGSDASYVTIYNQDITSYASANSAIRFLTNSQVDDNDTIYIDNVSIRYLKYPQCYITSVDTTSLPASYSVTTAKLKTVNIVSGGSCTSRFDFGFSKPNITISGRLRRDNNGLKDNLVNGSGLGRLNGIAVYAYLADLDGRIAFKTTLNASNGTYSFASAEINSNYIVRLSTTNATVGSQLPGSLDAPAGWESVGESYGTNNNAGTGPEAGVPDASIRVDAGTSNVTNVDFGAEMVPESDHYLRSINQPRVNDMVTLNGQGVNPPVLSGADPEDCVSGCDTRGKTVIIDTVPLNSELYYNNALLVDGQSISNFNPDLFQIRITSAAIGDIMIRFFYSFVDAAGVRDPSPASYTVMWGIVLPAEGLTASVNLNDDVATINWHTLTEENTSYFEVEQSFDNTNFKAVSQKIDAAGSSVTRRNYKATDNIKQVDQPIVYYRIRLVDINGKVSYSNIVAVRLSKKPGVAVWPNPFQSTITVSVTTLKETMIDIKLIDVNGQTLYTSSQQAARGITRVTISDLQKLPAGVYLVEITDRSAGATFQKLIKNN